MILPLRERISLCQLGEHDSLSLTEEDVEVEALSRVPPEIAELSLGFHDGRSRHEFMTLTIFSNGTFQVGRCGTVMTERFFESSAAVARSEAFVREAGLRPKVRPRSPYRKT